MSCSRTCVLLKDHKDVTPVRLKLAASRSRVKHSTTEPLRSQEIDEMAHMKYPVEQDFS